jgi:hypothetical protein
VCWAWGPRSPRPGPWRPNGSQEPNPCHVEKHNWCPSPIRGCVLGLGTEVPEARALETQGVSRAQPHQGRRHRREPTRGGCHRLFRAGDGGVGGPEEGPKPKFCRALPSGQGPTWRPRPPARETSSPRAPPTPPSELAGTLLSMVYWTWGGESRGR